MHVFKKEIPLMEVKDDNIVLFHPHVGRRAVENVTRVLESRWIGQGPLVDEFERKFLEKVAPDCAGISVGSGTDALHLAYLLAGIEAGDEVLVPVFTCTATNIPLLYIGAKVVFVDVDPDTLNINIEDLRRKVTSKTKAIVVVHYAGYPVELDAVRDIASELGVPVIEDAAQALGASVADQTIGNISEFTVFSFQAIKHISTGDGGFLTFRNKELLEVAKRLRWFGIDRSAKQLGVWENDIREVGYKYQMTDVGAAMGLAGLEELDEILEHRRAILEVYQRRLSGNPNVKLLWTERDGVTHAAWLATIAVDRRVDFQLKLWSKKIETNQVHYRNDRYSIFGQRQTDLTNMNDIEERYVCLPIHTKMGTTEAHRVCDAIEEGW